MSSYADFLIQAEPETTRSIGDQVLRGAGFRTVWDDHTTGRAERGSLPLTIVFGVFVGRNRQFVKVGLTIFAGPQPGTTVMRLTRRSSGWIAGFIGASRNKTAFGLLIQDLAAPFGRAGTLLGVTQG